MHFDQLPLTRAQDRFLSALSPLSHGVCGRGWDSGDGWAVASGWAVGVEEHSDVAQGDGDTFRDIIHGYRLTWEFGASIAVSRATA